ncbi:MAG: DegT/DnrJ/EryC1/StrS family aminotransferase [Ignavibacteria bacterium]|nr:DegT/DnrJ/EryC1/StrS family aminotransferase [Ignavibacteria bacterium]
MNVPLLDLKAQYQTIKPELDAAVLRVAESQYFILGPDVEALEKNIAAFIGTKHAIGVSSGTDALLLAMMALGIGPGDGVIVPTFSFFATAGVVSRLNAVPIFVDIDPVSYNIAPAAIERAIAQYKDTVAIKAIVPVHLYGQSADMDAIMAIAAAHNLHVIEDAAQAIGTEYKDGRKVGSIGTVGCFSFFPSKNLGGYGDGGVITVNDDALAQRIRIMRVHGGEKQYYHQVIGGNFRLDALQAAVLNVKLPHLNGWSDGRRRNAALYTRLFMEHGAAEAEGRQAFDAKNRILLPARVHEAAAMEHNYRHIYNQYCIRVQNRDGLVQHLRDAGIGCAVYYPVPFHEQECFADVPSVHDVFPVSDDVCATILALPVYPELTEEMVAHVAEAVVSFM